MLWENNRPSFTLLQQAGNSWQVTGDNVNLSENYSLVYEIPGHKPVGFTMLGQDLFNSVMEVCNGTDWELYEHNIKFLITDLCVYVTLWNTLEISPKFFRKISEVYDPECVSFIKSAHKGSKKDKAEMREFFRAYFYLKFATRPPMAYGNTLHIVDIPYDQEILDYLEKNWRDEPIVKCGEVKSLEELLENKSLGRLKMDWVSNPGDVVTTQ